MFTEYWLSVEWPAETKYCRFVSVAEVPLRIFVSVCLYFTMSRLVSSRAFTWWVICPDRMKTDWAGSNIVILPNMEWLSHVHQKWENSVNIPQDHVSIVSCVATNRSDAAILHQKIESIENFPLWANFWPMLGKKLYRSVTFVTQSPLTCHYT